VEEYHQIIVANLGHEESGKGFGDLVIKLRTAGHGEYRRDEAHLHKNIQVALSEAVSGSSVRVKMLDETIRTVVFDHLVADGEVIEVKGAGLPLPPSQQRKDQALSFGSLFLHVQVRFPTSRLSQAEKDALRLLLPDEHEE
jgi:DnaJ-class molecular chaperone